MRNMPKLSRMSLGYFRESRKTAWLEGMGLKETTRPGKEVWGWFLRESSEAKFFFRSLSAYRSGAAQTLFSLHS